jgi:hypothetical protein
MSDEALKKELIQMRMELHRQEMRHEVLLALQPLQKIRSVKNSWQKAKPWISLAGLVTPVVVAAFRHKSSKKDKQDEQ